MNVFTDYPYFLYIASRFSFQPLNYEDKIISNFLSYSIKDANIPYKFFLL